MWAYKTADNRIRIESNRYNVPMYFNLGDISVNGATYTDINECIENLNLVINVLSEFDGGQSSDVLLQKTVDKALSSSVYQNVDTLEIFDRLVYPDGSIKFFLNGVEYMGDTSRIIPYEKEDVIIMPVCGQTMNIYFYLPLNSNSIFWSDSQFKEVNNFTISEFTGVVSYNEIAYDYEKNIIYLCGNYGTSAAASNYFVAKIENVRIENNKIKYDNPVINFIGDQIISAHSLIFNKSYLYVIEQLVFNGSTGLPVKIHKINSDTLALERSIGLDNSRLGNDVVVNDYGVFTSTGGYFGSGGSLEPFKFFKISHDLVSVNKIYQSAYNTQQTSICEDKDYIYSGHLNRLDGSKLLIFKYNKKTGYYETQEVLLDSPFPNNPGSFSTHTMAYANGYLFTQIYTGVGGQEDLIVSDAKTGAFVKRLPFTYLTDDVINDTTKGVIVFMTEYNGDLGTVYVVDTTTLDYEVKRITDKALQGGAVLNIKVI
jgi:hypothetical protein